MRRTVGGAKILCRTMAGITLLAVAFGGLTWLALESREVVVIRTRRADQGVRETRIWIAEAEGAWWLEAASPESDWYRDVLADPHIEIVRGGRTVSLLARPVPGEEGHEKIRRLLRQKYGLADVWIAMIQDGSRSVLVAVKPADGD
jgi:hypothetical protein